MKNIVCFLAFVGLSFGLTAQVTTDPFFISIDDEITITFDATKAADSRAAGLIGLTEGVYLWSGVGNETDPFDIEPSGQTDFGQPFEPGTMTFLGNDVWSITLTPKTYYDIPDEATITKLGMVFKNGNGMAQTENFTFDVIQPGEFKLALGQPDLPALFDLGETFDIEVFASQDATINIAIDGINVATGTDVKTLVYNEEATTGGDHEVVISATSGNNTDEIRFSYLVRQATVEEPLPAGIVRGINYDPNDNTKATLCLQAPNKESVYVVGEFNEWSLGADYQMKKDGELFWVELSDLTPGTEYAFQYLVDESIFIADPYTDKIFNDLDRFIPENIYPSIPAYPTEAVRSIGFYNTVSVLQTDQTPYEWTIDDFNRPAKENLVIYELLVRDFFDNGEESYQNLIDTLSYIKSLGVNAIELMPITEFSGNDSWGYNPTFMFTPDKAYGTKNDLKEFIDAAHEMGIAVILDMVLNQQEQPSPIILLDFNTSTSQVTADNPYFNISATHPFNVFYDMNHESSYTQSFVDTVNYYWINEYKFDGFRFDLSKGFTQTQYGEDVGAWSSYDAGRIALLKRMADEIWSYSPDAYVILEHFADNTEETELANYGMMLWGNMHGAYSDNIKGTAQNIDWIYHGTRGWNEPNLVGYMESHDEERLMIDALIGRNINEALEQMKLAHAFSLMVPGPKMMWQFGELGYDVSIEENGRTGQKPNPWDDSENLSYYPDRNRTRLRKTVSELISLKVQYDVFTNGNFSFTNPEQTIKQLTFTDANETESPSSADQMSVVIAGNFSTSAALANIIFPVDGTWYNYFDQGNPAELSGGSITEDLQPGELRVYTNFQLPNTEAELLEYLTPLAPSDLVSAETENGVELDWINNSEILNGTKIYRKQTGTDWVEIGETDPFTLTFTDNQIENDMTYQYRVGSFTEVGEAFSNESEIAVTNFEVLSVSNPLERIYPNPTTGIISIESANTPLRYVVYQIDGKVLRKGDFEQGQYQVDLSELNQGTYLLEVFNLQGEHTKTRIIKN